MSVAIKSPITMRKIGERKATNNAYKIAAATIATTATIVTTVIENSPVASFTISTSLQIKSYI